MRAGVRSRRPLVLLVGLGVLGLVAALLLLRVGPGPAHAADEPHDADVLGRDVTVQQADHSYVVESVRAVVQGDRAFLLIRALWSDDDGSEPGDHVLPVLSGTVRHGVPYAGMETTCGVGTARSGIDVTELELDCSGALEPDHVVAVELRD